MEENLKSVCLTNLLSVSKEKRLLSGKTEAPHTHSHEHPHARPHDGRRTSPEHDHSHARAHTHACTSKSPGKDKKNPHLAPSSSDISSKAQLLPSGAKVLTIRLHSGIAGDMFVCGLLAMLQMTEEAADEILNGILPALKGSIHIKEKFVGGIRGLFCEVLLPSEHAHRTLKDILEIIDSASMSPQGKLYAQKTFRILAKAEGLVHGVPEDEVHFHEVGALDSILDICLACELFAKLNPRALCVSPLPVADGEIDCAHGVIPTPAPAVQAMLEGVAVRPFAASGETVTPTGLALLKAFGARFGAWPSITIERIATVYGTYEYEGVPNGATFAVGCTHEF